MTQKKREKEVMEEEQRKRKRKKKDCRGKKNRGKVRGQRAKEMGLNRRT